MIRSLELVNFRRHENTRLEFSPDSQIVAITGRNGAGKTTVLEAIQFAMHGETRHGRRGIGSLVRRGAEHEGMTVRLEFDVAGTLYRIERRFEKGKHSAALYAGNTLHTQTADGVTKAITNLLGMDAVGFRLATIAKQKELDGLAELTPAIRRKTIARLLRLDAVQAAVLSARETHRSAKTAADALGGVATVPVRQAELDLAEQAAAEADAAHAEALAALAEVEQALGATSDVEAAYRSATLAHGRAEATRDAARAEHDRIREALDRLVIPAEPAAPTLPLDQVSAQLAEVDALIARGRAQSALVGQLAAIRKRLAASEVSLAELQGRLAQHGDADLHDQLETVRAELGAGRTRRSELVAQLEAVVSEESAAETRIADAGAKAAQAETLGAVCDACGQEVSEEHRHAQAATLATLLADLGEQRERHHARAQELREEGRRLDATLRELTGREQELVVAATMADNLRQQLTEAERSAQVYRDDIGRLEGQVETIDLDGAYTRKTELEAARVEAESAAAAAQARTAAQLREAELLVNLADAAGRLEAADAAVVEAAPSPEVIDAWQTRQQLLESRDAEREFVAACAGECSASAAKVEAARKLLAEARTMAEKVSDYRTKAEVSAKTATLLDAVARRMATQIRPQLEGQISAMLQLMSEGRFTTVQVSDDYEVLVCDHDGRFYPVNEYSGGEADLIALAIRLALAQIVSARHGAGGAGFLILDEVFGSQDEGRRQAILEALRRLRATYGQILLISHVGGIEDSADMVLDIGRDDEDEVARVAVA